MRVLALTIGVALVATSAQAKDTSAADKEADGNKVVCKYEQRTGTKFPKKICLTKAQREQLAAEARTQLRESMGNNGTAPVEPPIFPNGQ